MIKAASRQCFLDLAMQYAGNAEAAVAMSVQNEMPITEDFFIGQQIKKPVLVNEDVVTLYRTEKAVPASKDVRFGGNTQQEGIDYWIIENDFIVQ